MTAARLDSIVTADDAVLAYARVHWMGDGDTSLKTHAACGDRISEQRRLYRIFGSCHRTVKGGFVNSGTPESTVSCPACRVLLSEPP